MSITNSDNSTASSSRWANSRAGTTLWVSQHKNDASAEYLVNEGQHALAGDLAFFLWPSLKIHSERLPYGNLVPVRPDL